MTIAENDACTAPNMVIDSLDSYPHRDRGLLNDFAHVQELCDPVACVNQYHAIQSSCGFTSNTLQSSCSSTECTTARELLSGGTCTGMDSTGKVTGVVALENVNMMEFGMLASMYCDTTTCSTFAYELECQDVVLGACTPECSAAVVELRAKGPSGSNSCTDAWKSVYEVHRTEGLWLAALEEIHGHCTGSIEWQDPPEDASAASCLERYQHAATTCEEARVNKDSVERCQSVACLSAVNAVVRLHSVCTDLGSNWPLEAEAVEGLAAVQCPCQDHDLTVYEGLHTQTIQIHFLILCTHQSRECEGFYMHISKKYR